MQRADAELKIYQNILKHISLLYANPNLPLENSSKDEKLLFLLDCCFVQYQMKIPKKKINHLIYKYATEYTDQSENALFELYDKVEIQMANIVFTQNRKAREKLYQNISWLSEAANLLGISQAARTILQTHFTDLYNDLYPYQNIPIIWYKLYLRVLVPFIIVLSLSFAVGSFQSQSLYCFAYALPAIFGILTLYRFNKKRDRAAFIMQKLFSCTTFCIWGTLFATIIINLLHWSYWSYLALLPIIFGIAVVPSAILFEKCRQVFLSDTAPMSFLKTILFRLLYCIISIVLYFFFILYFEDSLYGNIGMQTSYQEGYDAAASEYQQIISEKDEQIKQLENRPSYNEAYNDGYEIGFRTGRNVGNEEGKRYQYTIPDLHLLALYYDTRNNEKALSYIIQNTTSKTCYNMEIEIEFYQNNNSIGTYRWGLDNENISPGGLASGYLNQGDEDFIEKSSDFIVRSITWLE